MPVDPAAPVSGSESSDTIQGTDGADTLFGLGGDDSLVGDLGNDSLVGGSGDDTLRGGYGDDTLEGGDGDDSIEGLYGNDLIDTGAGNDHVFGRDGDDLIYGREGDDHLIGSIGTDTVYGGSGNDTLAGSQGNDEIHGGDGNDLAFIGVFEDSDRIFMDAGNDFVDGASAGSSFYAEGGAGNDRMYSGVGEDTLLGGRGNDTLSGGSGNDILSGGGDHDVVSGGDGDDVFMVQDVPGSLLITDFGANGALDLIDLSAVTGYDTAEAVSENMTFGPFQSTLNLDVMGGTLVITIQHATPLSAADLGLSGALSGTDTGEGPAEFGGDDDGDDDGAGDETGGGDTDPDSGSGGGSSGDGTVYSLVGPDASIFVIDPDSGDVSYQNWFTPNYDEVWDMDRDHIYEVSVVGTDADGDEVSRQAIELVVSETDAVWQEATPSDDPDGGDGDTDTGGGAADDEIYPGENTAGVSYALSGADASIFVIDPDSGDVSYQNWFTPNYDEVWDMDRDHIYEVSVVGTDADGDEVSRQAIELVVSETDAVWQEATPSDDPDGGDGDTDTGGGAADDEIYPGENAAGVSYALSGADASIFVIDPETGDVSYQNWFTPSYDEVWDMDRDHIYEVSVVGTDANGDEVSRQAIELVVSETDAVWQETGSLSGDPEEPTASDGTAAYLDGSADGDLLDTFDAAADLYIDGQGNGAAPIFDGSIDWHSSVHAHLANVAAFEANGDQVGLQAFADARFAAQDVQAEIDLNVDDPYGWAWLLKLDTKLQENGIDNLAPAGEHFSAELEADLATQIANGSTDQGEGSYNDANWKIANLIQYAQHQGDTDAEVRYLQMFDEIQADTAVDGDTSIADGDFFSSLSLSAYAHVVAGSTDTEQFQNIHDQMLESVTDGSLDAMLDTEGARLDAGIGFSHSAGVALSSAYGYWALFEETQDPAFYDAYSNVMEWSETYAPEMAESIAPGHWLPNFASFGADLPDQMPVEDPDGTLTAQIEHWQANDGSPVTPDDAASPDADTAADVAGLVLIGGAGDDVLTGGAGADVLDGLGGKDTLDAGAGDDTLRAGFDDGTGDVFIGGAGTDTYDIANSSVTNYDFNVDLADGTDAYGNSLDGIENILGGSGNDTLTGDDENNLLHGGDGDDVLVAGAGDDVLTGGAGGDTFTVTAHPGALNITDFGDNGEADQIDVSELGSVFADPEQLMAALSFADGVTSFNIELGEENRLVTIESEEELEEEDFIF